MIPAYQQMAKLFRDNYWLAHPETRGHYQELIEFVELWERWLAKSIPAEVIQRLEHTEDRLKPFYEHLEKKHDLLRSSIELAVESSCTIRETKSGAEHRFRQY